MINKIAFIGSVGSGKTTIIEQLSSIETLKTDVKSSIDIGKENTTVGIDYGHIKLDSETTLALYGVPGQRKFSMIWDFVKEGLWAIVILIKNNEKESINELSYLIDFFEINKNMPCVIGITHADQRGVSDTSNQIQHILKQSNLNAPIYTVDARKHESALLIMETIIALEERM